MRVLLDNQLITYLFDVQQGKEPQDLRTKEEAAALHALIQEENLEFLVSEESLIEIRKLHVDSPKRPQLENLYHKLKTSPIIKNAQVKFNDPNVPFNSPDVFYDHAYTDENLNDVRALLQARGNHNDFDARYLANALLKENNIDVFLTADRKSLWNHRKEIKTQFGITVMTPTELQESVKNA